MTGSTRKRDEGDMIVDIETEVDYQTVLKEIETLMHVMADTPEGGRLDMLVTLVEAYEAENYPLELPDPISTRRLG